MGGFNQSSVNANGGVAWAKQVADSMTYSGLDDQIAHYQKAATQLQKVQATLQNVKNNLSASWTGDAADQAQASFQSSIDQAVQAHDTIQAVVPPLQSAQTAQNEFVSTMKGIANEKSVPSNSITDEASHMFFGSPLPSQLAESHNSSVRTQAANALNKLSSSYEQSASDMHLAVSSGGHSGENGATYTPASVGGSSGDGLAAGYGESVGGGGGETFKAGYVPSPNSNQVGTIGSPPPTGTAGNTDPVGVPVATPVEEEPFPVEVEPEAPIGGGAELITDEPGSAKSTQNNMLGDSLEEENPRYGSKAGVFDENGFSDGQLTGGRGTGSKVRSMAGMDEEEGTRGGSRGGVIGEEENPESMSGMGGGRGGRGGAGGGEGEGEEELSSKYSRGRYFDGEIEQGERSSRAPVRSAFENATDGEGNKVDMMGGRRGSLGEDEEEERGKRPKYLTEDEFWGNAQRVVPPVIQ